MMSYPHRAQHFAMFCSSAMFKERGHHDCIRAKAQDISITSYTTTINQTSSYHSTYHIQRYSHRTMPYTRLKTRVQSPDRGLKCEWQALSIQSEVRVAGSVYTGLKLQIKTLHKVDAMCNVLQPQHMLLWIQYGTIRHNRDCIAGCISGGGTVSTAGS